MALQAPKISNPLTLIAVFASLSEIAGTVVLPGLEPAVQALFVWFVMLFPCGLVLLFFLTLNFNAKVLYAPGDFSDEANFLKALFREDSVRVESFHQQTEASAKLREFWKPQGKADPANARILRDWLHDNGLANTSLTVFLRGSDFDKLRAKAVADLNLE